MRFLSFEFYTTSTKQEEKTLERNENDDRVDATDCYCIFIFAIKCMISTFLMIFDVVLMRHKINADVKVM